MSKRKCNARFVPRWDEEDEVTTMSWSQYDQVILDYRIADRFRKEAEQFGNIYHFTTEVVA